MEKNPPEKTIVDVVVEVAGGQAALAAGLKIKQQSVHGWVRRGVIPAERVLPVEALTGVPRHQIRPDLYPIEVGA